MTVYERDYGPRIPASYRESYRLVDAGNDAGWDTEVFHDAAKQAFKEILHVLESPKASPAVVRALTAEDFSASRLRPSSLGTVYEAQGLTVRRPNAVEGERVHSGVRGLTAALEEARAAFGDSKDVAGAFKIDRVDLSQVPATTSILVYLHGSTDATQSQVNARWNVEWVVGDGASPPRLKGIALESYEEVRLEGSSTRLFVDCTEAVFAGVPSFREQILPSLNHWRQNLDAILGVTVTGHHGIAIGDVNGDGLEDIYAPQPAGLPNRLYVQKEDGTLVDISREAGVDFLDMSRSALIVDLDNDGDQDLVVQTAYYIVFLANDGEARFERAHAEPTMNAVSLSCADYDLDGLLDVYSSSRTSGPDPPIPYHDAENGDVNSLFRNLGGLRFENVTAKVGLDQNNTRFSFASAWEDYDDDGDADLYVANDFGRNNLYRNDGGTFVDVAGSAGVEDISAGMGVTWSDYDDDGDMDLYVSNMYSSAGGRIAYQRRFHTNADRMMRGLMQRHARGNSLFRNNGDGTFEDVSVSAGVTMGRWAWGGLFADLNNDSLVDIVVPNGFITNEDPQDL